ncbi:MAG: CoA transferase, partial [Chloroflexi bacterium]|nr:CoA transferase [Chloroflexota bacterium]
GAECANAILTALWHREQTGEGQHIDTSIYEPMQLIAYSLPTMWVQRKEKGKRSGARYTVKGPKGVTFQREIWPCKDGFISFGMRGGPARIPPFQHLVQWMKAEGAKVSHLDSIDWKNYNNNNLTQEEVDKMTAELQAFFMSKTAKALYEAAVEKVLMIAPIYNPELQLQDRHLQDRKFFVPIEHPELKTSIVYPGAFAKSEQAFVGIRHRAPLIGEHNIEVYETELGLTRDQLVTLKEAGII